MDDARLEAVVMAAGEGRRLRPLTERYAKPVLPIDGVPVVAALMRELAAARCRKVTVVVGHLAEQVQRLLGDGGAFAVEVVYAEQPSPDGPADAVLRAIAAGAAAPFLVVAADTLFRAGDIARFGETFTTTGAAGGIAGRRDPPPGPRKPPLGVEQGRVTRVIDHDPANPLASAPLWALGARLLPFLAGLSGPPYELADAFQRAIGAGEEVLGYEIGRTRDLTYPLDLVGENFPYLGAFS